MAFKRGIQLKSPLQMTSFIDMLFMILIFYLVTCYRASIAFTEKNMYIPTPKNEMGRAQIVIQFIDDNSVFWVDENASSIVINVEEKFGYLSPEKLKDMILSDLIRQNIVNSDQLIEKLDRLRARADLNPAERFFVLIRCPNEMHYSKVVDVIAKISDTLYQNIKYGCVGGTFEQIHRCRRIYSVVEQDSKGGRQENIRIDF